MFLERQRDAAALEEDLRRRNQAARYQDAIHMVKNRLQNIGGMLQVLDKKCEVNNIHLETLDLLRQEHAEAVKLLADFVQEGNLQANVGSYDLNQLVLDVVSMQKSHFVVKRIDLETALAEDLPKVWLDRQRIKQVIISCMDNSFEAILAKGQPGGRVLLTTQLDKARGMVRLLVEDNGVGLSAEQQANFFKPYYTTKPQGNGIGTSISESIVRLHGGR
ncbi:MAG: ATP-binding protein, partial [Firmicutes bacterium]|nr:ATP-binding protein [Bacillota bacterium]